MYIYLAVLIISAITTLCNVLLKKYQSETKETFLTLSMFNFVNAATASVFFIITNGFKVNMNTLTLLFSIAAAIVVALNIILNVYALSVASLAVVSIITTAGTTVGTSVFGSIFLNEKIELTLLLSIILLLIAVSLPFVKLKIKGNTESENKRINTTGIFICISLFILSGLNVIISKLYAINPDVCSSNSFFFMLNFILVIVCTFILSIYKIKRKISVKQLMNTFSARQNMYVSFRTLLSNVSTIPMMLVLAKMDISLYAILTTSFALIGNTIVSRYYFKENISAEGKISIILAIVAIILTY